MKNNYYFLFDMDGTVLFTDKLNNESYNYALKKYNFPIIQTQKRITRKLIKKCYSYLEDKELTNIIQLKQNYFINNIKKAERNEPLFSILQSLEKNKCILWTSADKKRAKAMIMEFNLSLFFSKKIISEKKYISEDIKNICAELSCKDSQLLVFENDPIIVNKLKKINVSCFLFIHH